MDCSTPELPVGHQLLEFTQTHVHWVGDALLNLQYFSYLMQRANELEKTLVMAKDWRQKKNWAAEEEMVRQYHQLNRHESEQTLEDRGG